MEDQAHDAEKTAVDGKKSDAPASAEMHVVVHAPYKVYYDGTAQSISAANDTGPFDILPQHHNFMTLLSPCDIVVRHGEEQEKITIQRGVMHVKADEVIVFLDV